MDWQGEPDASGRRFYLVWGVGQLQLATVCAVNALDARTQADEMGIPEARVIEAAVGRYPHWHSDAGGCILKVYPASTQNGRFIRSMQSRAVLAGHEVDWPF